MNNPGINRVIADRKSTYAFSSRAIDDETLLLLFEAARWAPSSYNEQPWRFIYAHRGTKAFDRILSTLYPANKDWASGAAVLVLTVVNKFLSGNNKPNKYAWYDLGQSVGNISAQATDLGLKMHQMGGFDAELAEREFNIGDRYMAGTVIAIGYPGDPSELNENLLARERSPKSRKSLDEIAFNGYWLEEVSI